MHLNFESSLKLKQIGTIKHGFFTREKGISVAEFAHGNCSFKVLDDPLSVAFNRKAALSSLGLYNHVLMMPAISHSNKFVIITQKDSAEAVSMIEADALITDLDTVALAVTYADCVPVLVASHDGRFIAAIHAGWRGIQSEVIIKTVQELKKTFSCQKLIAAIGPCISVHGFSITQEVLAYFSSHWSKMVREHQGVFMGI